MQIKQAQYKNGRKVSPIKTEKGLTAALVYAKDPDDKRHKDKVKIVGPYGDRCKKISKFKSQAVSGYNNYEESKEGTPGARSTGEIVEQLIFNPDPDSNLTGKERRFIVTFLGDRLAPESAYLGYWHVGINGRNRDDLHLFINNTVQYGDPALRKTELLKRTSNTRNYRELLRSVEDELVTELNIRRLDEGRKLLPTNAETRALRLKKRGLNTIPYQIAERLNFEPKSVTKPAVTTSLQEMGFTVFWDQDLLRVEYPKKKKRKKAREDRFVWKKLRARIVNDCDERNRMLEKLRLKSPEKGKQIQPDKEIG